MTRKKKEKKKKNTCIIDLARAGVYSLEQFVHFFLGHLLAQVCQDIFQLADTNEACHVLIKHLETSAVFLRLAGVTEATRAVQDALE